jgi:hypothetical protein
MTKYQDLGKFKTSDSSRLLQLLHDVFHEILHFSDRFVSSWENGTSHSQAFYDMPSGLCDIPCCEKCESKEEMTCKYRVGQSTQAVDIYAALQSDMWWLLGTDLTRME